MENVRLVEKQGFALLTEAQQLAAEKWRLQKLGPMALLDPETASKFGVTEEQSNALSNVLEGRAALVRSLGSSEKADEEIRKTIPRSAHQRAARFMECGGWERQSREQLQR